MPFACLQALYDVLMQPEALRSGDKGGVFWLDEVEDVSKLRQAYRLCLSP
jgi:hypothetical protein